MKDIYESAYNFKLNHPIRVDMSVYNVI